MRFRRSRAAAGDAAAVGASSPSLDAPAERGGSGRGASGGGGAPGGLGPPRRPPRLPSVHGRERPGASAAATRAGSRPPGRRGRRRG